MYPISFLAIFARSYAVQVCRVAELLRVKVDTMQTRP